MNKGKENNAAKIRQTTSPSFKIRANCLSWVGGIYENLKGAFEVAKGVAAAGQNFYRMAAPVAAALI